MARPLRIEFEGALYHIMSRGDRQECVFEEDGDREAFLDILAQVVERFNWVCHAYCLMDNHYHLLVETPDANLSRGMRQLNGVYTQKYNSNHDKVGHVFQGRFKAVLVERDSHLLEVCRYVVLNPVRAGMVQRVNQWRWSSYSATAGLKKATGFLSTDWVLSQFGQRRGSAQRAYRVFVREGRDLPSPMKDVVGGILLGSEEFVARCRELFRGDGALDEIPREQRYIGRPSLASLFDNVSGDDRPKRNRCIARAYLDHGYTMKAIGDYCGLHYSWVSVIIRDQEQETL